MVRGSAGDLGRLAGGIKRGLRMARGSIFTCSREVRVGEAGLFKHREEDLPRHGAGNSVGPLGLVRRDSLTDQSDIARLEPTARTQDAENLPQRPGLVRDQVQDPVTQRDIEARIAELDPATEIIAYCRGPYCVLSFDAVDRLCARGFRARRFTEGLPEWRAAGLPVETTLRRGDDRNPDEDDFPSR